ncbi:MAG TPA: aminoglycoside phosphotransferase family protein [Pyrinomonadaceae bacterium]|nr:aminoglycoside phosphotransferase family protein [Pyrinomonadaceae bacterium]
MFERAPLDRLAEHTHAWRVNVEEVLETETSVIAFGTRDVTASENRRVVLKVIKHPGDEWRSGDVLSTFDGHGVAQVYEHEPGAVLLERLRPGNSLADLTLSGRDEEATDILAEVIMQMSARTSTPGLEVSGAATVEEWARGFDNYIATGDVQISQELVEAAQQLFKNRCASQRWPKLLHGDLQHYNVLFDSERGWVAIDPKGVVGEIEYELGAFVRNPVAQPELFLSRSTIERRLKQFTDRLNLDYQRALEWAFAQAVLSAIWSIEDGFAVDATNPALRLAECMRPMLGM